jgi:hypothetical protein
MTAAPWIDPEVRLADLRCALAGDLQNDDLISLH